jgi:hypothetical protein
MGGAGPNDAAWRAYWDMMAKESAHASERAQTVVDTLNKIKDKSVSVTIHETTIKDSRTYWEHGAQFGADFIVPPGYEADRYPMRVSSGERVTVTPAGQVGAAAENQRGNTVIMHNYMSDAINEQAFIATLAGLVH